MSFLLGVSLIAIIIVMIKHHHELIPQLRAGSLNLKIGIFSLVVGWIINISSKMTGFNELLVVNQINSAFFLLAFICLIIGVTKFINRLPLNFNRRLMVFTLILAFAYTIVNEQFSFLSYLIPTTFNYSLISFFLYIVVVCCLIIEVYHFIFTGKVSNDVSSEDNRF